MPRVGSVHTAEGVRVWSGATQEAALAEACRRLTVMHEKWPQTRWHMSIRKDRRDRWGYPRHLRWAVYCTVLGRS